MKEWIDLLQGISILLLGFACILNTIWIYSVNRYFRDQRKHRHRISIIITGEDGAESVGKQAKENSRDVESGTATNSGRSDSVAQSSSTTNQSRERIL